MTAVDFWRVPTLLGVMACSALLLFAAAVVGSIVTRRRRSVVSTSATLAILSVLAALGAAAVRTAALSIAAEYEVSVAYVDPGLAGYLGPVVYAAFAFTVATRMLDGAWRSLAAVRFYAWFHRSQHHQLVFSGLVRDDRFPFAVEKLERRHSHE